MGSSNASVALAVVSGSEFGVLAVSPGTATVTVTASDPGGLSARMSFLVTVQPETQTEVVISGVEPTVLVEGKEARITGSGFSATAVQNQVSVGGRGARVTAATRTSLTIMVPRADCLSPRREELRVAVGSKSDARTVRVTPRSLETEPGNYWYTYGGNGCLHLAGNAPGAEYLIGVVSSAENPASVTGVTLTGTPWDASAVGAEGGRIVVAAENGAREGVSQSAMAALAQGPFRSVAAFDRGPFRPEAATPMANGLQEWPLADDTLRMRARAHNEIMARNEALLRRLGRAIRPAFGGCAARTAGWGYTVVVCGLPRGWDVHPFWAGARRGAAGWEQFDLARRPRQSHRDLHRLGVGEPGCFLLGQHQGRSRRLLRWPIRRGWQPSFPGADDEGGESG